VTTSNLATVSVVNKFDKV